MRFYDYIYYKTFRFVELLNDEIPSFIATGILVILNILQSVIIWSILLYFYPEIDSNRTRLSGLLIGILIFGFNWFSFEYKNRWRKIYKRFEGESLNRNIIGTILTICYILINVWICFKISVPWIVDNFPN